MRHFSVQTAGLAPSVSLRLQELREASWSPKALRPTYGQRDVNLQFNANAELRHMRIQSWIFVALG
jgi:hypothetical protein